MAELQSNIADRQQKAADEVWGKFEYGRSKYQLYKDAIIAAGAVPLLIAMLRSEQPDVQASAAAALQSILEYRGLWHKECFMADGIVPSLVALLRSDQPAAQTMAARILGRVSDSKQNADAVIAAGAVPLLVDLLRSEQLTVQETKRREENKRRAEEGDFGEMLDNMYAHDEAAHALCRIASGSQQNRDACETRLCKSCVE